MVQINVSKRETALVPKTYEGAAPMTMQVTGVTTTTKKLAKGGDVNEHRITLVGTVGDWTGDYVLSYLWDDDVMACAKDKAFTANTENWVGKLVIITAKKNPRGYVRWCVRPAEEQV